MTVLNAVLDDDQEELRKQLVFKMRDWACSLEKAHLGFDSAEQMLQFFVVDILTRFYYSFARDKKLSARVLDNMIETVMGIESFNKEE